MTNRTHTQDILRSYGDGLTTSPVCSISHSKDVLVRRGRLDGLSEMPLLPLLGINCERYVCVYVFINFKKLFFFCYSISISTYTYILYALYTQRYTARTAEISQIFLRDTHIIKATF
jgi:hypothetical protein